MGRRLALRHQSGWHDFETRSARGLEGLKIMPTKKQCEFSQLVYTILVTEKNPSLGDVASKLGMKYDTLYSRVHGRVAFRPEEVRQLIRIVDDHRLAAHFLDGTRFMAVDRPDEDIADPAAGKSVGNQRLYRCAGWTVIEVTELLKEIGEAIDDDKVDHVDLAEITDALEDAERALGSLRALVDARRGRAQA